MVAAMKNRDYQLLGQRQLPAGVDARWTCDIG